jgi:type IV pilus assembly protein PilC
MKDYVILQAESGKAFLEEVKQQKTTDTKKVIYGVSESESRGFFAKIKDFFVENSDVGLKEKAYFFHMLAVMIDAGIPLVAALNSLASRTRHKRFSRVLYTIAHSCEGGSTFSDAMQRFYGIFDDAEIGIVSSGEATGRLGEMLFKLSAQLDERYALRSKLVSAATYPLVVLAVLFFVAIGMLVWVLPKILTLFAQAGVAEESLPLTTRGLIALQGFLVDKWWLVAIIALLIYGIFKIYTGSSYGRARYDFFKLKMPIFGALRRKIYMLNFVNLFGILVDSGLSILDALKITGTALDNVIYKAQTQEFIEKVQAGQSISFGMSDSEFLFAPEVTEMMRVGENSASLALICRKIANQYQKEVNNTLKRATSLFEPLMILFVAIIVAVLAMAIMAPIFNLSSSINL